MVNDIFLNRKIYKMDKKIKSRDRAVHKAPKKKKLLDIILNKWLPYLESSGLIALFAC